MDIDKLKENQLLWLPELGIGYYEVTESPYDESYFAKYQSYEGSQICADLNKFRCNLVNKHHSGRVLDVGIGSGSFVMAHGNCDGTDVNPAAIAWLKERGLYKQPDEEEAITFWDSFEHIRDPNSILKCAKKWVFLSIPLFDGYAHVMRSKHFRKDEHYWYFTFNGLCHYMKIHGFDFIEFNRGETNIGREDIGSFVFKRK